MASSRFLFLRVLLATFAPHLIELDHIEHARLGQNRDDRINQRMIVIRAARLPEHQVEGLFQLLRQTQEPVLQRRDALQQMLFMRVLSPLSS